jgi:hypothetical protein
MTLFPAFLKLLVTQASACAPTTSRPGSPSIAAGPTNQNPLASFTSHLAPVTSHILEVLP